MTINKTLDGDRLTIAPVGRLDTVSAPALKNELQGCLDGVKELVFDFAGVEYISSAGLRVLLTAYEEMEKRGSMKVIHANEIVLEVFEVTGFSDILTIE